MSTSAELKQNDNLFIHPWDDIAKIGNHQRTLLSKGDGVYVYDSEGNRLLDAPAGMWCVNIGHGRQEMAQAVYDQIMGLTYVSPWSMTTGPAAEFAAMIAEQSPGDLNHVFFTTGGSTAVDSALRFVQFYNNVRGKPNKKQIIAQKRGYHGSTYLGWQLFPARSVTRTTSIWKLAWCIISKHRIRCTSLRISRMPTFSMPAWPISKI